MSSAWEVRKVYTDGKSLTSRYLGSPLRQYEFGSQTSGRRKSKRVSYENMQGSYTRVFTGLEDRENSKLVGTRVKPTALLSLLLKMRKTHEISKLLSEIHKPYSKYRMTIPNPKIWTLKYSKIWNMLNASMMSQWTAPHWHHVISQSY